MKTLPAGLQTILYENNQHVLADCYSFEFADGTRYWTTYESALTASPAGAHRYWRADLVSQGSAYAVSCNELQMRETAGGANVCTGGTAIASGYWGAGYEPSRAFDGVTNSANVWVSQSQAYGPDRTGWIGYDFGAAPRAISEIVFTNRLGFHEESPKSITVQWSDDGTTWTTAWTVLPATWTTSPDSRTFTGPTTAYAVGPGLERGDMRTEAGIKTDLLSLTLYPDATTIDGLSMFAAAVAGKFDGVKVTLRRAYMTTPGDVSAGLVTEFVGWVSRVEPSSTEIRLTVQSLLSRLSEQLPKRRIAPNCGFRLYSDECGVTSSGSNTFTVNTAADSTVVKVRLTDAAATDTYKLGTIQFNAGPLLNVKRNIRESVALGGGVHEVTVDVALPSAPASGVSATLRLGCDKSVVMCKNRFNNLVNFGGFPYAPGKDS